MTSRKPTTDDVDNLHGRVHVLQAMNDALERWPEVSTIAFASRSERAFIAAVQDLLSLDELQANAIAAMQVRRVSAQERDKISKQLREAQHDLASAIEQQED